MDFLKNIATPQSLEHFHLLLFVLNVLLVVYVPYLGFLLGSAFMSTRFEVHARRSASAMHRQMAAALIRTALKDRIAVVFMGVVPSLALVFVFTQLLQGTSAMSVALLAFSSIFLVAGLSTLEVFRFTFAFREILESVDTAHKASLKDAASASRDNDARQLKTGRYGTACLALSVFLLGGALALSANPGDWARVDSFFALIFSAGVLLKFAQLLSIAAGVTGAGILFYLDRPQASDEYRQFVRQAGIRLAVGSILLQPIFLLAGVALLPDTVLSGMLFGIGGASLAVFLFAGIFVYGALKEPSKNFAGAAFATMVIAVGFVMTNEQVAVHNATRDHAVALALEYEKVNDEFKASLGISTGPIVTGQDIYDGRCSACHLPDSRKVGPPFREVAAKYTGKLDALKAFIRNPVNNRPDYPAMPNQGLRPAEVDSVANFLLRTFGPGSGQGQPSP